METSAFGMVTILSLTLVSSRKLPVKLWSAGTISSNSTWEGKGNQLAKGTWQPANYVGTFRNGEGPKVKKVSKKAKKNGNENDLIFNDVQFSSTGAVPTASTNSYLLLRNDGEVVQYEKGNAVFTSNTAPEFAPIQWSNATSTLCLTAVSKNADASFSLCNGRADNQRWMLNSNKQVVNYGGLCLEGATGSSARSNTCGKDKVSQKWYWDSGYLRLGSTSGDCLKVIGTPPVLPLPEKDKSLPSDYAPRFDIFIGGRVGTGPVLDTVNAFKKRHAPSPGVSQPLTQSAPEIRNCQSNQPFTRMTWNL